MMSLLLHLVILVILLSLQDIASAASKSLQNEEVTRYIDVSSQLVIVNTQVKVVNKHTDPIDRYLYFVDPQWMANLSYIGALDSNTNPLNIVKVSKVRDEIVVPVSYEIMIPQPLLPGETTDFVVSMIITNYLKSSPKTVKQNERHLVLFSFNVYYFSIYFSLIQRTYLYLGTAKMALIDGAMYKIADDREYGLQYGPYYRIEPFKDYETIFHYENNFPFLVAEEVKRYIKLSHWGYITVWDQILLVHSGPKFKGPFERPYPISTNKNVQNDTRIQSFTSTLPGNAFDIYLKDEIGQVWSFSIDYSYETKVEVKINPRTILYGGWRTQYEIGYSLPISDYVSCDTVGKYKLSIPVVDKIFEKMVIKEAEINIILPEGAKFLTMDPYFGMKNVSDSRYCYYLDSMCREVISFKRQNLVENHIMDVTVTYYFSRFNLIIKPLTISVFLCCVFILLKLIISKTAEPSKNVIIPEPSKPQETILINKKNKKGKKQRHC